LYYIGDASGIISPITGEGIYYSLYTARIISECIKKGNPEISYEKELNDTIKRVKKELFIMKFIYNKRIQKLIFGRSHKNMVKNIINSVAKKYIVN